MLAEHGIPVFDSDAIGHELLGDPSGRVYLEIVVEFGPSVLRPDGTVDRSLLAAAVFSNEERRKKLERIVHPAIAQVVSQKLAGLPAEHTVAVLEAPLLLEAGWDTLVDLVVVVDCTEETQVDRFVARTGLSREQAEARLNIQLSRSQRLKRADVVLDNSGTEEDLRAHVAELAQRLRQFSTSDFRFPISSEE